MTNITLLESMINRYNKLSFTHMYMLGFEFQGNIYMAIADSNILPYVLKLDRASRGGGYALRFCPNKAQKVLLLPEAQLICSKKFFEETVKNSKYNKGEIFEKMITELNGQIWEKDNKKFTECGDIEINGTAYQIKFEKATFTNEKTLLNMLKRV